MVFLVYGYGMFARVLARILKSTEAGVAPTLPPPWSRRPLVERRWILLLANR